MSMVYKAEKSNDSNKNNCSCTKMQKLQENNEKGEKNSHTKIQNDSLCQESNKWLKSNSCTQIQASMVENSAKCQSNNYSPPPKKPTTTLSEHKYTRVFFVVWVKKVLTSISIN